MTPKCCPLQNVQPFQNNKVVRCSRYRWARWVQTLVAKHLLSKMGVSENGTYENGAYPILTTILHGETDLRNQWLSDAKYDPPKWICPKSW